MNRDDFPILQGDMIYFDNAATTLKPKCVIDKIVEYYKDYSANIHRGEYKIANTAEGEYNKARTKVKEFINAKRSSEIIFTKGATDSLNMIVFGFMRHYLEENDEVLITKSEHASNILPWYELQKEKNIKVNYIDLDDNYSLTLENVKKAITKNTKVISIAHITNAIGDIRDINEIGKLCKDNDILFVVDAAQSLGHKKIDVENISFLAASAHKMLGPTGVGILYGKYELLEKLYPIEFGGGMNATFTSGGEVELKDLPERLEAGTPNIAGAIGLGRAIDYINEVGINKIEEYEKELKKYLIEKLSTIGNIEVYNKNTDSAIVLFNLKGVFPQDTSVYLDHYNICIRAGNHCDKILKDELNVRNTCRISLYFYNTKEEIDKLVEVLNNSEDIFRIVI